MSAPSTTSEDRLRRILAIVGPILVALLALLSLCTLGFASLVHDASPMDASGAFSWQAKAELILAYCNSGWVGLLLFGYLRGRFLVLLSLLGFVVNYAAWVVMTIQVPN